jgi:hypothetical protein
MWLLLVDVVVDLPGAIWSTLEDRDVAAPPDQEMLCLLGCRPRPAVDSHH